MVSGGEVLATGYHDRYRGPHAERMAFDYADAHGIDLTGATVIDTLEPCCHVGSQPACTALILAHGIARVVVGSVDPNPIVAGKGLRILEEAGVEVVRDVMRRMRRHQSPFLPLHHHGKAVHCGRQKACG